jgi:hypothetical protein
VADAIAQGDVDLAQSAMREVLGEFPATVKGVFEDALSMQPTPVPEVARAPQRKQAPLKPEKRKQ